MEKCKKLVLFDFDGVIADTFSFCYDIINSVGPLSESEYRTKFEGNINDARGKETHKYSEFDFWNHYKTGLMKSAPDEEIFDAIKKLSKIYTLIIISSTNSDSIASFLSTHKLQDYFAEILGNDTEKSKVKKIKMVLDKYSIAPTDTIFITDTLGDIREAEECGVKSIAVTWGYHPAKTLEKGNPYRIITKQNEIIPTVDDYFKSQILKQ